MHSAINQFNSNIETIKKMEALYEHLTTALKLPKEIKPMVEIAVK